MHESWPVVVVGGGAAGLVAAERSASRAIRTLLLEKNAKLGVKILMSGGTRCNLTHATDSRGIVAAYGPPGRFLHSALAALSPQGLVDLVESEGVRTKVEETGKIFPVSDRAVDILRAFTNRLHHGGCEIALQEPLIDLKPTSADGQFELVTAKRTILADQVIITTGGQSYPGCGTTGDGYRWAQVLGHRIVRPTPALVPITTSTPWVQSLSGITIPDVELQLREPSATKPIDVRGGSLLFTHFGLSGPVALDISRGISGHERPQSLSLRCDFLPSLSRLELESEIQTAVGSAGKKHVVSLIPELLPRRLAETLCGVAGLAVDQKIGELSKAGRAALVAALKQTPIQVSGTRGFAKAEVTAGGVSLSEVDSRTMQSKLQSGLYLAGEVLDLDGPIGGYNFQAAFSTGWLAGLSVSPPDR